MPEKSRQAVGVDLGAIYTRCVVAERVGGSLHYVGRSQVPSAGWVKGEIVNGTAVRDSVMKSLLEAGWDEESGIWIGVGGWKIRTVGGEVQFDLERWDEFFGSWALKTEAVVEPKAIGSICPVFGRERRQGNLMVVEIGAYSTVVVGFCDGRIQWVEGILKGLRQIMRDAAFGANMPFMGEVDFLDQEEERMYADGAYLGADWSGLKAAFSGAGADFAHDVIKELVERGVSEDWIQGTRVIVEGEFGRQVLIEAGIREAMPGAAEVYDFSGIEGFPYGEWAFGAAYGIAMRSAGFRLPGWKDDSVQRGFKVERGDWR